MDNKAHGAGVLPAHVCHGVQLVAPRRSRRERESFSHRLILNRWFLRLFGVETLEELSKYLKDEDLEGLDDSNVTRFHRVLVDHFHDLPDLPAPLLFEYDQNIVRHTLQLSEARMLHGEPSINWKYFQYLGLLATEIYLDRYFSDPIALRAALNDVIVQTNEKIPAGKQIEQLAQDRDAATQLNKLAFWMATGSGKTLLMHVNVRQFLHYIAKHKEFGDLNRVLLLTPNEGLSRQHLAEFQKSGVNAELFNKDGLSLFTGRAIEILEVSKLREEMGDKTVAIDAFESNNLVLVDEGHRGASAGEEGAWMRARNALSEKGFSFEYSATFAQVAAASEQLADQYAKAILFDYSYRHFHADGFGKDYRILNLEVEIEQANLSHYLVACLLTFYQQLRLHKDKRAELRPFNLEKPLLVFVGGSVTATLALREASDIVEVLTFLAAFVASGTESTEQIRQVLNKGIVSSSGHNIFADRFVYLNSLALTPAQIFRDMLALIFNAQGPGQLYIKNIKGTPGELALSVGADSAPFGVINVGDDAKLLRHCAEKGLTTSDLEFAGSLFSELNEPASRVNVLIGSRKFTEGWNSWRVSTMGLINVGRGEGAQIIQLFGRGVRLRGYDMRLKRSSCVRLPSWLSRPQYITELETLGIFGIRASYMAQFREFLEQEGAPTGLAAEDFRLSVILNLGKHDLKVIRVSAEVEARAGGKDAFKRLGPTPVLDLPNEYLQKNKVILNWYPKIESLKARGLDGGDTTWRPHEGALSPEHVALLDISAIYYDAQNYKSQRGWHNLTIPYNMISKLLLEPSWYELLISEEALAFDSADKVEEWQRIAEALLRKYVDRYYTYRKRKWELPRLEYRKLESSDPNLVGMGEPGGKDFYSARVDASRSDIVTKLQELKPSISGGLRDPFSFGGLDAVWFGNHLYEPLFYLQAPTVELSPVPLNDGERKFVDDLKTYCQIQEKSFFIDKELYLLRNLSRGRGIGFFEAGNFFPDFILWLIDAERQRIAFVDPKGLRNLEGLSDAKIQFHVTIKDIESRLHSKEPSITLDSFILSVTPSKRVTKTFGTTVTELASYNVLFQEDPNYVRNMLQRIAQS